MRLEEMEPGVFKVHIYIYIYKKQYVLAHQVLVEWSITSIAKTKLICIL